MIKHIYDKFAEKYYHGGRIFIYSDSHFGDLDCYKLRFPEVFNDTIKALIKRLYGEEKASTFEADAVAALDNMQIEHINKVCNKSDTLIMLGDVGDTECVKKLKAGYKVLIMGNHDKGASNYKRVDEYIHKFESEMVEEDKKYKWTLVDPTPIGNIYERVISNNLFDEVYEGPLFISEKILLSHEPVELPFGLNIHGHVHNKSYVSKGLNVCAEAIDYKPICFNEYVSSGALQNVETLHRITIDTATERKKKRGRK